MVYILYYPAVSVPYACMMFTQEEEIFGDFLLTLPAFFPFSLVFVDRFCVLVECISMKILVVEEEISVKACVLQA